MRRITLKQDKFVNETLKTLNPTAGALAAYDIGSRGGKDIQGIARAIASENLTKPAVQKAFQERLGQVNYDKIISQWENWATEDTSDKRTSLAAGIELMKLGDKYPAGKMKLGAYKEELGQIAGE